MNSNEIIAHANELQERAKELLAYAEILKIKENYEPQLELLRAKLFQEQKVPVKLPVLPVLTKSPPASPQ